MKIQFLLVPYDSGRREWRMGRGPSFLLRHGVGSSIRALGHDVEAEYIEPSGVESSNPPASTEIATSFSLYREVALRVRATRASGALPIVVGGNCGVTLGAMAGQSDTGVLWLDAHADFNTPETTTSGFLDGMVLAALTGRCWRTMTSNIPGFVAVSDERIILTGARDFDAPEQDLLAESEVAQVRTVETLVPALDALRERVSRLHFHLDCDVLDAGVARANSFAAAGGLTIEQLGEVARLAAARFEITSAAITAYDPAVDTTAAVPAAIATTMEALLG
ncbi:MAG TPA: arginase family protein [Gemmatimonadaceae bacterium]|nr:arginase family protein [Gemmatimonadaceae bacterium]